MKIVNPQISFVMPTRDRGNIISQSIKTIIDQTIKNWELIVVDDHSKAGDKTKKAVQSFNDSRIRYIRIPDRWSGGIAEARNFGNMFARAPIIAVADSDDLYMPERAKLTIDAFKKYNCDVFYGQYDILNINTGVVGKRIKTPILDFDIDLIKKYNLIPNISSAYKREIAYEFPYNSFFRKASDYDFFARLAKAGKKFYFCPTIVARAIVHGGNITLDTQFGTGYGDLLKNNMGWNKKNKEEILYKILHKTK
ncbi:MAG: putative N-acetylgalactosaminyl-diphosphoundecaprenol glucuronosyltransferase [Candidatus Berkelbacteria bacterium Licking1014_85]|uniref:Putative N-acetylgalactosaminyl-diphosphoundecaprenol glucuronosyltransferase n=1 Tax=Candidatus Berkelbacteria bacterium Licking1014_85 TaxID=2017148 RepID=A0A554LL77_9BACT|nr:MAG: putative N-acetylgalactosaminyl-diphosphoundecaprenol glucuronosyltransferase [Candidatus Berkelbacteria bacterium Licking1014_85]